MIRLRASRFGGQESALRLVIAAVLAVLTVSAHAQAPATLAALDFLLGDWDAIGLPPGESGAFNFTRAIQDRVIIRTNYAKYPARDGKPASRHDDLMVIFVEGDALKADYFDNEQHVIRYTIETRAAGSATFLSEPKAGEPRYRLSYTLESPGRLKGSFEMAAPATEDFTPLFTWTAKKLK